MYMYICVYIYIYIYIYIRAPLEPLRPVRQQPRLAEPAHARDDVQAGDAPVIINNTNNTINNHHHYSSNNNTNDTRNMN